MAIDENKKPIICPHKSFKSVENEPLWKWECENCGARFKYLPNRVTRRKRDA